MKQHHKPRIEIIGPLLAPKKLSYSWQLKAGNGRIMATGTMYGRRSEAKRAAFIVKWLFYRHPKVISNPVLPLRRCHDGKKR